MQTRISVLKNIKTLLINKGQYLFTRDIVHLCVYIYMRNIITTLKAIKLSLKS